MTALGTLREVPDGARNVIEWDLRACRDFHPLYRLTGDKVGAVSPEVSLELRIRFEDDEAARDFEHKIRAMLPEFIPDPTHNGP